MATIFTLQDILAFFDLNLNFQKSHTSAPMRKEMAYEVMPEVLNRASRAFLDSPVKRSTELTPKAGE